MSQDVTISLSKDTYETLMALANQQGITLEALLTSWAAEHMPSSSTQPRCAHPHYMETDDWLRHLGMNDEQIRRAEQEAEADADA
jgi:hypothetical protein